MNEQKEQKIMKCVACNKEKPVSKGKVSPSGSVFECWECYELLGKGVGYK